MAKIALRQIRIEGNTAYIPLTRGCEAIIDAKDIDFVVFDNWTAKPDKNTVYASRSQTKNIKKGKRIVLLHRLLMQAGEGQCIDHIDGNGLNNRRDNLRVASYAQNAQNRKICVNNSSGFKGVSWCDKRQKWRSRISAYGKNISLSYHDSPELAHIAYADASTKLHGEFGRAE